jgi:hypothetical protein
LTDKSSGIDTLDVGFFIEWPEATWEQLTTQFEAAKSAAAGTPGVMWPDGEFLVMAGGKPPRYRWHLDWPEFHLFLAQSAEPRGSTPNGYAKLLSQSLWEHSPPEAVRRAIAAIEKLGGKVWGVLPSRVDLAADFVIPGGRLHEFLMGIGLQKLRSSTQSLFPKLQPHRLFLFRKVTHPMATETPAGRSWGL